MTNEGWQRVATKLGIRQSLVQGTRPVAERHRAAALALRLAVMIGVVVAIAGCAAPQKAFGPVQDVEQAKAAALFHTSMQQPVTVVGEASHGMSGELYKGPSSMCSNEEACRANEARRHRLAWKVHLRGMDHGGDCAQAVCPLVPMNQILIIDETDGTVLYSMQSEGFIE